MPKTDAQKAKRQKDRNKYQRKHRTTNTELTRKVEEGERKLEESKMAFKEGVDQKEGALWKVQEELRLLKEKHSVIKDRFEQTSSKLNHARSKIEAMEEDVLGQMAERRKAEEGMSNMGLKIDAQQQTISALQRQVKQEREQCAIKDKTITTLYYDLAKKDQALNVALSKNLKA